MSQNWGSYTILKGASFWWLITMSLALEVIKQINCARISLILNSCPTLILFSINQTIAHIFQLWLDLDSSLTVELSRRQLDFMLFRNCQNKQLS